MKHDVVQPFGIREKDKKKEVTTDSVAVFLTILLQHLILSQWKIHLESPGVALGQSLSLPIRPSFCRLDPCYSEFLLLLCKKHCSHIFTIRQLCSKYPYLTPHYFSYILLSQHPKSLARFFFSQSILSFRIKDLQSCLSSPSLFLR